MNKITEFYNKVMNLLVVVIAILATVILLAGCAVNMSHPTKAANHNDFYECQQVGERRAATWSGSHGAPNPILFRDFTIECLERRGWTKQ